MLKRPTSRRKSRAEGITLNLVPILDTLVTLIAFLLFTMSFLSLVHVESPFPEADKTPLETLKEKPLQLTVTINEADTEIWSPSELIPSKTIPNPQPGQPDARAVHEALLTVKQKFPTEHKVVVAPYSGATYDVLISLMDSMRLLEPTDPAIYVKNPATGNNETEKFLFPEIIFGNLLGDT